VEKLIVESDLGRS